MYHDKNNHTYQLGNQRSYFWEWLINEKISKQVKKTSLNESMYVCVYYLFVW